VWKWLRGRRRLLLLVLPALLVAAGVTSAWFLTRDPSAAAQSTTATVTRETVKQTVSADGTVEASKTREESFEVAGTVTAVLVEEGEKVTKGEVLATVGRRALIASRRAAAASLAAAYTQLDDDQDAGASDVQVAADQTAIVSARATLADAREAVEDATLRATIAGTVTSVGISRGDTVGSETSGAGTDASDASDTSETAAGTISIVSTGSYVVDATVAAEDVQQVEKGMQAELTVSGRDDTVYGTVSDVGLVAQTNDSGAAVFPVTIAVTGKQQDLYAGVSATASIVVKQVPNALTVNSRALSTENGTTYVTKLVDGEDVRTEVETGGVYGMATVITSGLEEGDEVVVPGFIAPTGGSGGERQQLPDFQMGGMQPPAGGPAQ
jgi:macrolide-specific efflux system membrane fusion protein